MPRLFFLNPIKYRHHFIGDGDTGGVALKIAGKGGGGGGTAGKDSFTPGGIGGGGGGNGAF